MYEILENTPDFVLLNKFPGSSFHQGEKGEEGLFSHLKKELQGESLHAVHRLDQMTSGLLVIAKGKEAAQELSDQFQNRQVEKYYLALSDHKPKKKQGMIKGDMEKGRRGGWMLLKTNHNPSITQFFSTSVEEGLRLFLIKPYTGKTHQIRVALKSISSPAIGDPMYAKKDSLSETDRGYLHSYSIAFELNGKSYRFVQPPSHGELFLKESFIESLKQYAEPSSLAWPKIKVAKPRI